MLVGRRFCTFLVKICRAVIFFRRFQKLKLNLRFQKLSTSKMADNMSHYLFNDSLSTDTIFEHSSEGHLENFVNRTSQFSNQVEFSKQSSKNKKSHSNYDWRCLKTPLTLCKSLFKSRYLFCCLDFYHRQQFVP